MNTNEQNFITPENQEGAESVKEVREVSDHDYENAVRHAMEGIRRHHTIQGATLHEMEVIKDRFDRKHLGDLDVTSVLVDALARVRDEDGGFSDERLEVTYRTEELLSTMQKFSEDINVRAEYPNLLDEASVRRSGKMTARIEREYKDLLVSSIVNWLNEKGLDYHEMTEDHKRYFFGGLIEDEIVDEIMIRVRDEYYGQMESLVG